MTDETPNPTAPEPDRPVERRPGPAPLPGHAPLPPPARRPSSADTSPRRPEYRGEELDPERGPGLGCFWFQVLVLGFFIVIIPIGLNLNWPFELLAILLFVVIGLLLLTGQTVIFLLRLVAADRRAQGRRRPLASATKTVGELEDEMGAEAATEPGAGAKADAPEADVAADQVQPVDPASITRARRLDRPASDSPREPAAGDDGAVPSVGGAAASMPAAALGERSSGEGTSDVSPPPMHDSSTASQRAAPEEAAEPAAAEPSELETAESETAAADTETAESETAAADIEPADSAPPADAAAGAPADREEPDPGVRQ